MISERYLLRLREAISCRKELRFVEEMAVRSRRINAVFFFSDESRDLFTAKRSISRVNGSSQNTQYHGAQILSCLPVSPAQARSFNARNWPVKEANHSSVTKTNCIEPPRIFNECLLSLPPLSLPISSIFVSAPPNQGQYIRFLGRSMAGYQASVRW